MKRRRRQRQLDFTFRRLDKNGQHRGGARPGSGRKPRLLENNRRLHPHSTRPSLDGKTYPVHVTLRISRSIPNLRTRALYRCIRLAVCHVVARAVAGELRVVHLSIQRDHLHLLVETRDRFTLSSGMRAFTVSAAKRLNQHLCRRGPVFIDRYHATPIKNPTQARNALAYVLNNWRKHAHDVGRTWRVDPFSSGIAFPGWLELRDSPYLYKPPPTYEAMPTAFARTWLLRAGWKRAGTVSVFERPGPQR